MDEEVGDEWYGLLILNNWRNLVYKERFCFRGRYKAGSQQFSLLEFQIMELDASATRFLLVNGWSFFPFRYRKTPNLPSLVPILDSSMYLISGALLLFLDRCVWRLIRLVISFLFYWLRNASNDITDRAANGFHVLLYLHSHWTNLLSSYVIFSRSRPYFDMEFRVSWQVRLE